ncbi:class I adenylate-forming enzyme family protein [Alkalihalobacterium alkalinitrilicum]|uniref:class I adenylate-forming enzyme family protein n=1 Tax=Alkalihalobacterium alkalinitrilicum TaxID=427920 RepID=UPI000994B8B9|nr:long-chain-fatty-acid--CoA ligase [Alkalihalobacterium alkalinitrilicum]
MNITSSLALNARRHPEKLAVTFKDREYTYRQFNENVNRLAHGLSSIGLQKGEKLAIMMKNSDYFAITYFAAAKLGAVIVPVNFRLVGREVNYILDQSDSVMVVCDQEFEDIIQEASRDDVAIRNVIVTPRATVPEYLSYENILTNNLEEPDVEVLGTDDLHILYTSGTTGKPKGALFDHQRVVKVAIGTTGLLGLQCEDKLLHVAPLFHCAQLCLFLLPGFFLGATNVIEQDFHPVETLKTIEKNRITLFFGVPTMYNFFTQVPNVDQLDLSSIARCGYGAAPMSPDLVKKSMELFKTDQFYNLCGLTEGGPTGIYLTPDDHETKIGKSGKWPTSFTEVKVVNENGDEVEVGEIGELILRGETIMKEYYNKPEETAKTLRDGWLYTGDLASVDEDGYISLVDRRKDMVITGGENVYSVEVEYALDEHPHIVESAVIGTPDPKWGELVTAVIVVKEGEQLSEEEINAFCRQRLAGYKVPKKFLFIDQLPRNASGKIQKFILREKYTGNPVN